MTEPTATKRPRCDNGNGSFASHQHDQVTSSSSNNNNDSSKLAAGVNHDDDMIQSINRHLLSEADRALQESNKRHIKPVVDESKLGIELFVGDRTKQYHGLIKARYADFTVHEIDLEGKLAQLTSLEPPEDEDPPASGAGALKIEDLLDFKVLTCLSNVNQGLLDSYRIDVTGMDKDMRTSIHYAIKAAYERLDSSTVSENNVPVFKKQQQPATQNNGQHVKSSSPPQPPPSNQEESITTTATSDDKPQEPGSAPVAQQVTAGDGDDRSADATAKDNDKAAGSTVDFDPSQAKDENEDKDEEKKYILVKRRNKVSRPQNIWPRNRPDYTHFVLYKENKDTMDAIHNVAIATHSKPSQFNYAGTKDRRAVTTQWVSSWRLDPRKLLGAMRRFNRRPYLKAGNFCFKKEPIRLGQLRANKFDIVIRHLVHNSGGVKVIEDAMESVKANGFVNYFGLQRFGTRSVSTHEVGLAILQGKWDKAVDLILSYRYDDSMQPLPTNARDLSNNGGEATGPQQQPDSNSVSESTIQPAMPVKQNNKRFANGAEQHNACIDLWKAKQDADLVFKKYPHFRMTNEGMIIRSLSRSNNESVLDYSNAVASLPRNTRSMYVHSYQSLIWNKLTTLRLQKFGYKVVPGDLIIPPESNISDNSLDILLAVDDLDTPETDNPVKAEVDNVEKNPAERKMPVEELDASIVIATEDNLDQYTIFDVVLPLIGTRVRVPNNDVGRELERLLSEDGLTLDSFRAREKAFLSYGSYRKIMVRPNSLQWSIKQYSNPHENLIDTDLDLLNKGDATETASEEKSSDKRPGSQPIKNDFSDEALIVGFELPPSAYATMCLRELMKKPSTDFNNRF